MGSDLQPRRKRFGQHFLHDPALRRRIVSSLDLEPSTPVLEIGPGGGALTELLLDAGHAVVAIEIDRDLTAGLLEKFHDRPLTIVNEDVLSMDLLALAEKHGVRSWQLLGNLPYNISKPVSMRLVEQVEAIECAVLMYQLEVAGRLVAQPGASDYAPLTVLAGACFEIEQLFRVKPKAFRPPPKVDSAVTRWRRRAERPSDEKLQRLRQVLGVGFANRRKTLANNLRRELPADAVHELLERSAIDGRRRAETLTPEEWATISEGWPHQP